jgi:hypothetical protein
VITGMLLAAGCGALVAAHLAVRVGVQRQGFTASEAFVLGHWPFILLNCVLLALTGGHEWSALDSFAPGVLATSAWIVVGGLASFVVGSWLGAISPAARKRHALEPNAGLVLVVGAALAFIGAWASIENLELFRGGGWESRSTSLILAAQFAAPGVALCVVSAFNRALSKGARTLATIVALAGVGCASLEWSRRLGIVVVAAVLVLWPTLKRRQIPRSFVLAAVPVLVALAIAGMVWRMRIGYGVSLADLGHGHGLAAVLDAYGGSLWLEASAFSGLMVVVERFGLATFAGGGSLLLPFLFWIPRAYFPWKPEAFELGGMLATPYSIGPSLYGEVLVNFTVIGVFPFIALLGFVLKRLDLRFCAPSLSPAVLSLYVLFVFDTIFLVRGSFANMVEPMLLHLVVPLIVLTAVSAVYGRRSTLFRTAGGTESRRGHTGTK